MAAVLAEGWRGQWLFAWTTKPNGHYHTSHKHEAFSALVIEPQGKFASRLWPKVSKQTFQHKVRILTSKTCRPDMTSQVKSPTTTLPRSHYIVNVRLIQWSKTFHLANESVLPNHTVPSPRSAYPTLTPSTPWKTIDKSLNSSRRLLSQLDIQQCGKQRFPLLYSQALLRNYLSRV